MLISQSFVQLDILLRQRHLGQGYYSFPKKLIDTVFSKTIMSSAVCIVNFLFAWYFYSIRSLDISLCTIIHLILNLALAPFIFFRPLFPVPPQHFLFYNFWHLYFPPHISHIYYSKFSLTNFWICLPIICANIKYYCSYNNPPFLFSFYCNYYQNIFL